VTTSTESPEAPKAGTWAVPVVGLLVICVVTFVLTWLSLDNVTGATRRPNGGCCDTSFVNSGWWLALAVAAVPIAWVWMHSRLAGLLAVVIPTYATFYIASTTIQRYQDSGWGDGLEVLSYVGSIMHLMLFLVAATVGYFVWRRRRRTRLTRQVNG
jgi:hypothetical protein